MRGIYCTHRSPPTSAPPLTANTVCPRVTLGHPDQLAITVEQISQQILKAAVATKFQFIKIIGRAGAGVAGDPIALLSLFPASTIAIIVAALGTIRKHFVGFVQAFKLLRRCPIVGVQIGVQLTGQLTVRLFDRP